MFSGGNHTAKQVVGAPASAMLTRLQKGAQNSLAGRQEFKYKVDTRFDAGVIEYCI